MIDRADLKVPTRTGLPPLDLLGRARRWPGSRSSPLGEGVGRAQRALGGEVDLCGYGPVHVNAVALGSLLYGFAAVLLIHDLLRRHFRPRHRAPRRRCSPGGRPSSTGTWSSSRRCRMPPSAAGAALVVWLWDRPAAAAARSWSALALGLATGFAMCLRWQNALLLLLPAWERSMALRRGGRERRGARRGRAALLGAAALVGALPADGGLEGRSTASGCCAIRRTARTSCASIIRSSCRRCSRRATACSPGRPSSGPATSATSGCCDGAGRWPGRCCRRSWP